MKDHSVYLIKLSPVYFKFGITKNIRSVLQNTVTTGYTIKPVLIGESENLLSLYKALKIDRLLRDNTKTGDGLCSDNEVKFVVDLIKEKCGFDFTNPITIAMDLPEVYKPGMDIILNVTSSAIKEAANKCTDNSSVTNCVLACALLRQGFARPDVRGNRTRFNKDGKRYTAINSEAAYETLLQFDEQRSNLTPRKVELTIVKVENIKTRKYSQPKIKTKLKKEKPKPRRTVGRDKGLRKYFVAKSA